MNGRLYDPVVGRFLNADPVIQNPGHTQSYNRYSYCLNNPLKYADPSGNIAYNYWRDDRSGYDGGAFNFDFSFPRHSGGGAGSNWVSAFTSVLMDGYTGGADAFLNSYNNQRNSPYYDGTMSFHYFTQHNNEDKTLEPGCNLRGVTAYSIRHDFTIKPSSQGGHFLKDLTDITGWASTIRTAGEMDWNSMAKAQQQKVAYNMQKSLKSNGTRMYTKDIKANINGNFKILNYKLGFASGVLIGADILTKGEIRPSHVVNGIMTGVGLTVWGSPVAAGYFLIDLGMGVFYDGGLSGYIDDTWGSPLYDF